MVEYIVGPVLAVLISMKFTDYKAKKQEEASKAYLQQVELVEKKVNNVDEEILKKVLVTITPVAKAVKQLQESIGVRWV